MALPNIPSIQEIYERIISDIETAIEENPEIETGQKIPTLTITLIRIIAKAFAGVCHLLYKKIVDLYYEIFPQTASEEGLVEHGLMFDIKQSTPVQTILTADVPGTSGIVSAGTLFKSSDNGVIYRVVSDVDINGGIAPVSMLALTGGNLGNLENGSVLDISRPLSNLEGIATVTGITQSGSDGESITSLKSRVILRYKTQANDGLVKYALWALEFPECINAYPWNKTTQTAFVEIYCEVNDQTDGIPTEDQLRQILENYIDVDPDTQKRTRRAAGIEVETYPISRSSFDVQVAGLTPDTSDIRNSISEAATSYFLGKEPYLEGVSIAKNDNITQAEITAVIASVASSNEASVTSVVLFFDGLSISEYFLSRGEKAKLDVLVYV